MNSVPLSIQLSKIKSSVLCGQFAALIAIGAFIRVPVPYVPFTLQFLFACLAGIVLGAELGGLSVLIYICLGLFGLPIFAMGGGIAYIFQPTFGYLIGFCLCAYITGKLSKGNPSVKRLLIANFAGLVAVYVCGAAYYYFISNYYTNSPVGALTLFIYCFALAVPGDILLSIVGAFLGKKLIVIMKKRII